MLVYGGNGMKREQEHMGGRHLSPEQQEDISAGLQGSTTGTVSISAPASDQEAVGYQCEIASVLVDSGFKVEIDNAKAGSAEEITRPGVEATIADNTVRPRHAYRIVDAFRRAGIAIATRISARRKKDTLHIAIGPNDAPASVPWTMASVIAKWKTKFAAGLWRPKDGS